MALVRERYGARAAARRARRARGREPRARSAPSSPASPPAMRAARRRDALRQRPARRARRLAARPARVVSAASSTSCWRSARSSSPTSSPAFLAHPDWARDRRGPGRARACRSTRDAVLVAVATVGTTLAPWGLAFIQSYAVDKRLTVEDLRYERIDVIVGARADRRDRRCSSSSPAPRRCTRSGVTINDAARRRAGARAAGRAASPRPCSALGFLGRGAAGRGDRAAVDRLLGLPRRSGARADLDDSFAGGAALLRQPTARSWSPRRRSC